MTSGRTGAAHRLRPTDPTDADDRTTDARRPLVRMDDGPRDGRALSAIRPGTLARAAIL